MYINLKSKTECSRHTSGLKPIRNLETHTQKKILSIFFSAILDHRFSLCGAEFSKHFLSFPIPDINTCIHTHIQANMYVRTHVCMRITKVCIPMYTNMYIHKHTHIHTCVRTRTRSFLESAGHQFLLKKSYLETMTFCAKKCLHLFFFVFVCICFLISLSPPPLLLFFFFVSTHKHNKGKSGEGGT